jgi:hypothetical protein
LKSLGSVIKDIELGEQGRNFGAEAYEAIMKVAPELAS